MIIRRSNPRLMAALLAFSILPVAANAQEKAEPAPSTGKIRQVTLYRDRALVTRQIDIGAGEALRTITVRDVSGNVHVVPNGMIDVVTNMTKGFSRYLLDVGVAYREDVDEVISVMREVDEGMRNEAEFDRDMLEPIEILGLDRFEDSAVIVRGRLKTRPIQQWRIGREFNRRLKMYKSKLGTGP